MHSRNSGFIISSFILVMFVICFILAAGFNLTDRSASDLSSTKEVQNKSVKDVLQSADSNAQVLNTSTFYNNGNSNYIAINKPPSAVAGNFLLLHIAVNESGVNPVAITAPSGWNQLRRDDSTDGALASLIYYKFATNSEPSSYYFYMSSVRKVAAGMIVFSGVYTERPIDTSGGQVSQQNSAVIAPSVYAASSGERMVMFTSLAADTQFKPPTNMSLLWNVVSAGGATSMAAHSQITTAGQTGNYYATGGVTGYAGIGQVVLIMPQPVIGVATITPGPSMSQTIAETKTSVNYQTPTPTKNIPTSTPYPTVTPTTKATPTIYHAPASSYATLTPVSSQNNLYHSTRTEASALYNTLTPTPYKSPTATPILASATHQYPTPTITEIIINYPVVISTPTVTPFIAAPTALSNVYTRTTKNVINSPTPRIGNQKLPTQTPTSPPQIIPGLIIPPSLTGYSGMQSFTARGENGIHVDFSLQPMSEQMGSIFIGRITINSDNHASFVWDSENVPNGSYQLFAKFIKDDGTNFMLNPVALKIANTSQVSQNTTVRNIVLPSTFNPKTIAIDKKINVEKIRNSQTKNDQVGLTFSGKSIPNSIITLLIYSNPIVVTVKTDANGTWSYTLEKPLEQGKHAIYTVATRANGDRVRSEVADFIIATGFAASANNESLILESAKGSPATNQFIYATVFIIGMGIFVLFVLFYLKINHIKYRKI